MVRRAALWVPIAVALGVSLAVASAASARPYPCNKLDGRTVLENRTARVFKWHRRLFACSRSNDTVRDLGANAKAAGSEPLAGPFFVFTTWLGEFSEAVAVIDTTTGRSKTVYSFDTYYPSTHLHGVLVNTRGIVVWSASHAICVQGEGCQAPTSSVWEWGPGGTRTLAATTPTEPAITGLGLSANGQIAYWTENGQLESARIS